MSDNQNSSKKIRLTMQEVQSHSEVYGVAILAIGAVPNPKLGAQGARHPFNKPNSCFHLEKLDLATWLKNAEESCVRTRNISKLIENNRNRTLRKMET